MHGAHDCGLERSGSGKTQTFRKTSRLRVILLKVLEAVVMNTTNLSHLSPKDQDGTPWRTSATNIIHAQPIRLIFGASISRFLQATTPRKSQVLGPGRGGWVCLRLWLGHEQQFWKVFPNLPFLSRRTMSCKYGSRPEKILATYAGR